MIMNYVVRIKNLKVARLKTFLNYLNSSKHKNHVKKNTEIYELSSREDFVKISNEKIIKNKMGYIKNAKGGKPLQVLGKSLTFNIPTDFEFDLEKSNLIYEDLIEGLIELYENLPPFKKGDSWTNYALDRNEVYGMLHKQSNSHYHVVVPYLDRDGNVLRGVKSPTFTNGLKLLWNKVMIKHYGIDLEAYQPQSKEELEKGKNRRYLEDIKDEYTRVYEQTNNKYYKNQIVTIERLLKLNDSEINNNIDKIDTIEKNYKNAKGYSKAITKDIPRPTM